MSALRRKSSCLRPLGVSPNAQSQSRSNFGPPKREAGDVGQGPRTYIDCPLAGKDDARRRGARWDAGQRAWFVPFAPGRDVAPFARWLREPVPAAAGA